MATDILPEEARASSPPRPPRSSSPLTSQLTELPEEVTGDLPSSSVVEGNDAGPSRPSTSPIADAAIQEQSTSSSSPTQPLPPLEKAEQDGLGSTAGTVPGDDNGLIKGDVADPKSSPPQSNSTAEQPTLPTEIKDPLPPDASPPEEPQPPHAELPTAVEDAEVPSPPAVAEEASKDEGRAENEETTATSPVTSLVDEKSADDSGHSEAANVSLLDAAVEQEPNTAVQKEEDSGGSREERPSDLDATAALPQESVPFSQDTGLDMTTSAEAGVPSIEDAVQGEATQGGSALGEASEGGNTASTSAEEQVPAEEPTNAGLPASPTRSTATEPMPQVPTQERPPAGSLTDSPLDMSSATEVKGDAESADAGPAAPTVATPAAEPNSTPSQQTSPKVNTVAAAPEVSKDAGSTKSPTNQPEKPVSKDAQRISLVLSVNQELIRLCVALQQQPTDTSAALMKDVSHRLSTNLAFLAAMAERTQQSTATNPARPSSTTTPRVDVFPHPAHASELETFFRDSVLPKLYQQMAKAFEGVTRPMAPAFTSTPSGSASNTPQRPPSSSSPDRKRSRGPSITNDEMRKRIAMGNGKSPSPAAPSTIGFANPFASSAASPSPSALNSRSSPGVMSNSMPSPVTAAPAPPPPPSSSTPQAMANQLPPGLTPQQAQQLVAAYGPNAIAVFRGRLNYLQSPSCNPQFAALPFHAQMRVLAQQMQNQQQARQQNHQQQQNHPQQQSGSVGPDGSFVDPNGRRHVRQPSFAGSTASSSVAGGHGSPGFVPSSPFAQNGNGMANGNQQAVDPSTMQFPGQSALPNGYSQGQQQNNHPQAASVPTQLTNPFAATNPNGSTAMPNGIGFGGSDGATAAMGMMPPHQLQQFLAQQQMQQQQQNFQVQQQQAQMQMGQLGPGQWNGMAMGGGGGVNGLPQQQQQQFNGNNGNAMLPPQQQQQQQQMWPGMMNGTLDPSMFASGGQQQQPQQQQWPGGGNVGGM